MNIISFDVGIKNMAYCIFDVSNGELSIVSWNVLNLLEAEPLTEVCNQSSPGKKKADPSKPCCKIAKYRKHDQCFCEKHAKTSSFLIPMKKHSETAIKKLKLEEVVKLGQGLLLSLDKANEPRLKKDWVTLICQFYEKQCLEPIVKKKTKNAAELDLITVGKNMKEMLNQVDGIEKVTHVLIENQISPIANRMKTVQGMLAQYFIMKNSDTVIEFCSSANKLSQFTKKESIVRKDIDKKLENTLVREKEEKEKDFNPEYKQHKKDGIFYCRRLLETNPCFVPYKNYLDSEKTKQPTSNNNHSSLTQEKRRGVRGEPKVPLKMDDLADCFLQGLWYIKNKNIITYADDLKIIFV
jgi:hypothetical protein